VTEVPGVYGAPFGSDAELEQVQQSAQAQLASRERAMGAASTMDPTQFPQPFAPTQRPNEPMTSGLLTGEGGGPEEIPTHFVDSIMASYSNPDAELYRKNLGLLEVLASRPGATTQTRNFVRRLRSEASVR
jgi:hypothetical protein